MARPEDAVEFGLDHISPDRRIEIPMRDALRVYALIGELVAFFHTPRTQEEVLAFIGTKETGALRALWDAYYGYLRDVWPDDVALALEAGAFDAGPRGPSAG